MSKFIKISMVLLAFALLSTGYISAKEKCCDKEGKDSKVKTCDCKDCEDCKCGCKGDKECDCKKGDCKKGEKSGCGCKDKDAKKGHDDCPHKKQHYDGK